MIKDSGNRREFESGAVRDMPEGKGRCDLMPLQVVSRILANDVVIDSIRRFMEGNCTYWLYHSMHEFIRENYNDSRETAMLEVAIHFEDGARKYGPDNWKKGIPVNCYIDSAIRHYLKFKRGDTDEPHDRAFIWNLMCCCWEVNYHAES